MNVRHCPITSSRLVMWGGLACLNYMTTCKKDVSTTSTVAAHLIEVYHDVALWSSTAHNTLQHQGEEQPSGLRHVQVVGVVLVPVLNRCHHLVIICADYLQVLKIWNPLVEGANEVLKTYLKVPSQKRSVNLNSSVRSQSSSSKLVIRHFLTWFSQDQQRLDLRRFMPCTKKEDRLHLISLNPLYRARRGRGCVSFSRKLTAHMDGWIDWSKHCGY